MNLLASTGPLDLLYAVPTIVAVSLVYAATRHETMPFILARALRVGAWITGFMAVILGVLVFVTNRL